MLTFGITLLIAPVVWTVYTLGSAAYVSRERRGTGGAA